MEIMLDPDKVGDVLALAASVAKEKSPLAFLAGLVITAEKKGPVRVMATDAETAVTAELQAQVKEPGRVCVNARALMEVMRRAEGRAASLRSTGEGKVQCTLGQSRYQLGLLPAEEMPAIAIDAKSRVLELPVKVLAPMIADVKACAGAETSRYILNSVLLERKDGAVTAAATDGRRLAYRSARAEEGGEDFSFPVPFGAVKVLDRAFELSGEEDRVAILYDGDRIGFKTGALQVACRALEGRYPAWREAVPAEDEARFFTVDADKLLGAVEGLVRIVSDPPNIWLERHGVSTVRLFNSGPLNSGEEIVDADALPVAFASVCVNGRFLLEAAAPLRGKLAKVGVIRPDRPLVVQSVDRPLYRALIMPILDSKSQEHPALAPAGKVESV